MPNILNWLADLVFKPHQARKRHVESLDAFLQKNKSTPPHRMTWRLKSQNRKWYMSLIITHLLPSMHNPQVTILARLKLIHYWMHQPSNFDDPANLIDMIQSSLDAGVTFPSRIYLAQFYTAKAQLFGQTEEGLQTAIDNLKEASIMFAQKGESGWLYYVNAHHMAMKVANHDFHGLKKLFRINDDLFARMVMQFRNEYKEPYVFMLVSMGQYYMHKDKPDIALMYLQRAGNHMTPHLNRIGMKSLVKSEIKKCHRYQEGTLVDCTPQPFYGQKSAKPFLESLGFSRGHSAVDGILNQFDATRAAHEITDTNDNLMPSAAPEPIRLST